MQVALGLSCGHISSRRSEGTQHASALWPCIHWAMLALLGMQHGVVGMCQAGGRLLSLRAISIYLCVPVGGTLHGLCAMCIRHCKVDQHSPKRFKPYPSSPSWLAGFANFSGSAGPARLEDVWLEVCLQMHPLCLTFPSLGMLP